MTATIVGVVAALGGTLVGFVLGYRLRLKASLKLLLDRRGDASARK